MTSRIDDVSPLFLSEDRIGIAVDPTTVLLSERPITVNFDYELTEPEGVVLPLIVTVQPAFGDGTGFISKEFRLSRPSSFTFVAVGAGEHLIVIRESAHNRWQGRLLIQVGGEEFSQIPVLERF